MRPWDFGVGKHGPAKLLSFWNISWVFYTSAPRAQTAYIQLVPWQGLDDSPVFPQYRPPLEGYRTLECSPSAYKRNTWTKLICAYPVWSSQCPSAGLPFAGWSIDLAAVQNKPKQGVSTSWGAFPGIIPNLFPSLILPLFSAFSTFI